MSQQLSESLFYFSCSNRTAAITNVWDGLAGLASKTFSQCVYITGAGHATNILLSPYLRPHCCNVVLKTGKPPLLLFCIGAGLRLPESFNGKFRRIGHFSVKCVKF